MSDIWQFHCASRMRINNVHTANRWSDSQQSRVRARTLPVDENAFRVDNNGFDSLFLAARTWMKAWHFTTDVFTENFSQKSEYWLISRPQNSTGLRIGILLSYPYQIMIFSIRNGTWRSAHAHRKWKLNPIRRFTYYVRMYYSIT